MATGYTQPLHDGEPITFEQFALRCSRAMGAAIMQRDGSLDVEIAMRTMDDWEPKRLAEATKRLEEAAARSLDEWATMQRTEIEEATAYQREYIEKRRAVAARYGAMLTAVKNWTPPTPDHQGLKDFMVEQIESSIRFDCGDFTPDVPVEIPVDEYRAAKIARLAHDVEYAAENLRKEQERVRTQNAWVQALRDSLTPARASSDG